MSDYAAITENDVSDWEDVKGELYHFPRTYQIILTSGCKIICYTGKLRDPEYRKFRLADEPHYFGAGEIGAVVEDPRSTKGDFFCEILNYRQFNKPVLAKQSGEYLEHIPDSRRNNYWRFGVREISKHIFDKIIGMASLQQKSTSVKLPTVVEDFESFRTEEDKRYRYSSYYERDPVNRLKAIEIHGLSCQVCGFNFEERYGSLGAGFIHVHHKKPISESGYRNQIDPGKDLAVVCPNCHAMMQLKNACN